MRNLIYFISKNAYVLYFLFLELTAFVLIISFNNYQNASFWNTTNYLVANLNASISSVKEYFHLKEENEDLLKQNAELINNSKKSFYQVFHDNVWINDKLYKQKYLYTPAKIVGNSTNKVKNFTTIDIGTLNGVKKGMGVITPKGVLGQIVQTSEHFSIVMPVINIDSKISAKIKRNGYFGELSWEGINYRKAVLKDIPKHVKLLKGDTIITSGLSNAFPEGILIGTISGFELPEGGNFYNIEVEFIEDYQRIYNVYVIKNKLKAEQDALESTNPYLND